MELSYKNNAKMDSWDNRTNLISRRAGKHKNFPAYKNHSNHTNPIGIGIVQTIKTFWTIPIS